MTAIAEPNETDFPTPAQDPLFLTPVAEALELDIQAYWLGAEFVTRGTSVRMQAMAYLRGQGTSANLTLLYYASGAHVTLSTYGHEPTQLEEELSRMEAAIRSDVRVGTSGAVAWEVSDGARPVNTIFVIIPLDDAWVVAAAPALSSGIPGDDENNMLVKANLIGVLAEHLQPYAE
jgi:hypothetical protein